MSRFVCFLRAINVGGHTVRMEELRSHFESLGLAGVETFIASGNVIFESPSRNTRALRRKIEDRLRKSLGYEVASFIRTVPEVHAVARHAQGWESRLESVVAFNVAFLNESLTAEAESVLMKMRTKVDDFHVHGREVYWFCKTRQGESKFSNAVFERALECRATWRGLNTVVRLAAKYPL